MKLSRRATAMEPSATLEVVGMAKAMKQEGKPVISFGAGEPDFDSPPSALSYASDAMKKGYTHYTPATGIPQLKEEIKSYYSNHFNLDYDLNQIIVGAGAKPLLYEVLGCVVDPEDEVMIFTPAWVSYVEQIKLFDGKPVCIDTSDTGFIPTRDHMERHLSSKTRAIIVNTPNNPTGAVYDKASLNDIADFAKENDLLIIMDEIYERLVYDDNRHFNLVVERPDVKDRTLIINGVSKAYAMTGWRIGYALGTVDLIAKMGSFQGHLTSNPCSIAQWAAVGAMREAEDDIERMRKAFSARKDLIIELLDKMPHISFVKPGGAFYVWLNVEKTFGMQYKGQKITDDSDFCKTLLEKEYVAAVPGKAFLCPGNIRISYSNSEEEITEGMERLSRFLTALE